MELTAPLMTELSKPKRKPPTAAATVTPIALAVLDPVNAVGVGSFDISDLSYCPSRNGTIARSRVSEIMTPTDGVWQPDSRKHPYSSPTMSGRTALRTLGAGAAAAG
jgi:hypothetical protein